MAMYKLQPSMPTSQRWIQQEFDQLHYDLHKSRLRNTRPSIDTRPPKIYSHLEIKLKRLQLESNRLGKIENENRRLLKALVDTAERPSSLNNRNEYEPKSLNLNRRLNSTIGLLRDNEKIVNRLINVKPTHDKPKLDKQWEERERIMRNISRFQHPWRRQSEKSRKLLENEDEDFTRPTSLTTVGATQMSKPTILLKQVVGRQGINHRRARSLDAAFVRRRLDKIPAPTLESDDDQEEDALLRVTEIE